MRKNMFKTIISILLIFFTSQLFAGEFVVTYKSSDDYESTKENIEMAITGRGLKVSGVLHISEMLNRTGPDIGFNKEIYKKAESLEFCSAKVSHVMTKTDHRNLTICPFTVAVYILSDEPEQVYVSFRKPQLEGADEKTTKVVYDLLNGIAVEATE
jgi:uncharacterized protein (DUF302 family)